MAGDEAGRGASAERLPGPSPDGRSGPPAERRSLSPAEGRGIPPVEAFQGLRWRILRDPPQGAARNMAVDEALARARKEGEAVLRIYRWSRPSLSFGRNQPARGRYDPLAAAALGAEVVRRPTGGREVLHDRELTYSVVAPVAGPGSLRGLYQAVNLALLQALQALGVDAALADPAGRTPTPDAGACFGAPARGEVMASGRKLVGSAQVRIEHTLLQHGSFLLDQPTVSLAALVRGGEALPPGVAQGQGVGLGELLPQVPGFATVASTLEAAMAGTFGGEWERVDALAPEEEALARRLEARYLDPEWSWKR